MRRKEEPIPKIYGYLRVSVDSSEPDNQRQYLNEYAQRNGFIIDEFIEDIVSGKVDVDKRKLQSVFDRCYENDTIIVSEVSRIGRNTMDVMRFIADCAKNKINVQVAMQNLKLGDTKDPMQKMMQDLFMYVFAMMAEMERNFLSNRTKIAAARDKAQGKPWGNKKGKKPINTKSNMAYPMVREMYYNAISIDKIIEECNISKVTVYKLIKRIKKEEGIKRVDI
jgi:DNA invertase Pin-like site-specific DNA recombinase